MLYFDEDYGSNDIRLIELSPELLKILKEEKSFGELFIKHNGLSQTSCDELGCLLRLSQFLLGLYNSVFSFHHSQER